MCVISENETNDFVWKILDYLLDKADKGSILRMRILAEGGRGDVS